MNPWVGGLGFTVLADAAANVTGTCTVTGTTVDATTDVFTPGMVGHTIDIATQGDRTIVSYTDANTVEVNSSATCTSQAFTVSMDDSGALTASGADFIRDATTNPGGAAADILITPVVTDVWDVRVTAKVALSAVWIPWQSSVYAATGGAFFLSRLLGLRVDMTVAKELQTSGTVVSNIGDDMIVASGMTAAMVGLGVTIADVGSFTIIAFVSSTRVTLSGTPTGCTGKAFTMGLAFAHVPFGWQGDERTVDQYPGDNAFPAIGYDDGTTGTLVGLCESATTVQALFSLGRQAIKYGAMALGEVKTFRVYIGQSTTGNERARMAALVEIYGQNTPRPAGRVGDSWNSEPGFLGVSSQDYDDPQGHAYALWAAWGERISAMLCWGQMSNRHPTTGETTGCCLQINRLHSRNRWMRELSLKIQRAGGLFGVYTRPLDVSANEDPAKALEWMRCASAWCNFVYGDVIGSLPSQATLAIKNLLLERFSLGYPHAALVSGALAGGSTVGTCQSGGDAVACLATGAFSSSKQATASGSVYFPGLTDPGETRPADEGYRFSRWCRTCAWFGKVFVDATGSFTSRPAKLFIGVQNSDANYNDPDLFTSSWVMASAFAMGCGIAPSGATLEDYETQITEILDKWDEVNFWGLDFRYRDRIGLALTVPSSGVDYRRFTNSAGEKWIAVDQYALGLSSVTLTVDGSPIATVDGVARSTIPMTGRLAFVKVTT